MDDRIAPRHDASAERGRHPRRQVVVDAALLETAMRLTGRGQSDTLNEALAHLAELAEAAGSPGEMAEQSVAGC
jgi:hypothetical protein